MKAPQFSDDYLQRIQANEATSNNPKAQAKEKTKAKDKKKSRLKKNQSTKSAKAKPYRLGFFSRVFWFFFKLGLVAVILGSIIGFWYLETLHDEISAKFEGQKWQIPARIYARPLQLFEGARLSAADLSYELSLLPYQEDKNIRVPGTYYRHPQKDNVFALHTRQFQFWDGLEPAHKVQLTFDGDTLIDIASFDADAAAPILMRLEPLEIAGILSDAGEDRVLVSLKRDVPPLLVDTLIAVEDRSFRSHFGVDPRGVARAIIANYRAGKKVQGASTLTQQLIKNYFLSNDRTYARKLKELAMALSMEMNYSKEEILEAYLNEIWIGQDGSRAIHGFGLGAKFYYNRTLNELEPHQIAMLVGMLKSPTNYNPRRRPETAIKRRDQVLEIMASQGLITHEVAEKSKASSLEVAEKVSQNKVQYFSFLDVAKQKLREQYHAKDLESEGLKIFTTLDPIWQRNAEVAIQKTLPELEKKAGLSSGVLEIASVIVDPQLGEVKAVIGGRDANVAGFNRAYNAQRPIGSLIKPFVYMTALLPASGYTLSTLLIDEEFTFPVGDKTWAPKNYNKKEHGETMLITALAKSYNLSTARLGLNIGVERILVEMKKMGLTQESLPYPSILLGALNANAFDMAQVYSTLASGGYYTPLRLITEVTGANGEPLPRAFPLSVSQVVDEETAYLTNAALIEVAKQGTAKQLSKDFPDLVLAGKTGTTDDYRDSWYAGYGGNYLNVIWLGRDDNQPIELSGGAGALQVWKAIARKMPIKSVNMPQPLGIAQYSVDTRTGLIVGEDCPQSIKLPMRTANLPQELSNCGVAAKPQRARPVAPLPSSLGEPLWSSEQNIPTSDSPNAANQAVDDAFAKAFGFDINNAAQPVNPNSELGQPLQ